MEKTKPITVLLSPGQEPLLLERDGQRVIVAETQAQAEEVMAQYESIFPAEGLYALGEPIE